MDGRTDGRGATLNAAPRKCRNRRITSCVGRRVDTASRGLSAEAELVV